MEHKFKPKLTAKQQRFCDEYLIDLNGAAAARRSGYSEKTAHEQAAQLLAKLSIQENIQQNKKKLADKNDITLQMVLDGYRKLAFYDSRKFYDENGNFISIPNLDDETAFALAGFEVGEEKIITKGKTKTLFSTKKIKTSDRKGALDSICKVLGYNPTVEISDIEIIVTRK